eukprot:gene26994-32614_t
MSSKKQSTKVMSKERSRRVTSRRNFDDDNDVGADDDAPMESDEFYKRWAGFVLIGPFLPAIFAAFIIVAGQLVLNTAEGSCGYDLASVVSAFVGISYVFLLVFTWVYIGDEIKITIPMLNFERVLFSPFKSLKWVLGFYLVVGGIAFILGIYGAFILSLATFCQQSAPALYQFSLFVVTIFWLGFFFTGGYAVKMFWGTNISRFIEDKVREESMEEVENRLVRAKFAEFDKSKEDRVKREDLPKILKSLGVFVPEEEHEHLLDTLDSEGTGYVTFGAFQDWFRALNGTSKRDDDSGSDKSDEDRKLFS